MNDKKTKRPLEFSKHPNGGFTLLMNADEIIGISMSLNDGYYKEQFAKFITKKAIVLSPQIELVDDSLDTDELEPIKDGRLKQFRPNTGPTVDELVAMAKAEKVKQDEDDKKNVKPKKPKRRRKRN